MADTPRSSATLKTYYLTGEIPTQQQYADFITSYENVVDDNLLIGNNDAVTAIYPASQSTATVLTTKNSNVSTDGGGISGVKLQSLVEGNEYFVSNNTGYDLMLYPASGEQFGGFGANNPITIPIGFGCKIISTNAGKGQPILFMGNLQPYHILKTIISQVGTSAPTEVILKSNFPSGRVYARTGVGTYTITNTGNYNSAKLNILTNLGQSGSAFINVFPLVSPNSLQILTYNNLGALTDGILNNFYLQLESIF